MSEKTQLLIHSPRLSSPCRRTLGMAYTINALRNSPLFEIGVHDEYIQTCRDFHATIMIANGKRIYVDLWEYPNPSFSEAVYNANFDLIIKLQLRDMPLDWMVNECRKNDFLTSKADEEIRAFCSKMVPWSFFPSRLLEPYIGKEESLWGGEVKRNGFFCGKDWKCRRRGKAAVQKEGLEYINSDQEIGNLVPDKKFVEMMQESKFGIVLQGRGSWPTDAKNRREIDYMMMKKPILMNYRPFYYNRLVDGEHYIYWDGSIPLSQIEKDYDLKRIAENGYQWYLRNATPAGLASTFKQIIDERLS